PGELVGQDVTVLMPERFRPRHTAGVRHYEETGKKRISWNGVELVGLHKDGSEFPIEISFGEYTHEGARVFTGFIRDITDRKATEERERRRRRVIQTAAVYLGSSLVALQVADLLLPVLPLPDWTFRGLVLIGFLFFPVALALAWTFELSADRLRRLSPSGESHGGVSRRRIPGRLAWIGAAGLLGGLTLAPLLLQSASGPPGRA
ncbi:MAG: PAS domain S-box protein, partial [Gemmatimonadota bacterium]